MTEVLIGCDPARSIEDSHNVSSSALKSAQPRYESYLMTGDKIINLNHKVSPRYAEMHCEQLPPTIERMQSRRRPFDDFPSAMQEKMQSRRFNAESAVPASQSESGLNEEIGADDKHSSVTVNMDANNFVAADANGSVMTVSSTISSHCSNSAVHRTQKLEPHISTDVSQSEPSSPAKTATATSIHLSTRCSSPVDHDKKSEVNVEACARLAKRLYSLDGFKREDVAAHLSKNNEFGISVAEEYCALFNFSGIRLDAALRDFLSKFCLTGETQERARIIEHFAKRYHECNPRLFKHPDEVHALTCALLLLNSDLHGPNVGRRMSSRDFVDNLGQTEHVFDRALLKTLYSAIKEQPIKWVGDSDGYEINESSSVYDIEATYSDKKTKSLSKSKSTVCDDDQIEYKAGWVMRKCVYDRDGRRTPFGRRGWSMVYARLRGMVLYLNKDDDGFRRSRYQTFNNAILLHHSLSEKPNDYSKRQHVFKLRTANLGEFLFQTSDENEVQRWIDAINYVAAAFSSPALPAAVSNSNIVFHRPLLPSAPSRFSIREQLLMHEESEEEMRLKFEELMTEAPPLKARGNVVQDFFFKERYLFQERKRYETYVRVLREHLSALSPSHSIGMRNESYSNSGRNVGRLCSSNIVVTSQLVNEQCVGAHSGHVQSDADWETESEQSGASYKAAIAQNAT